MLSSSPGQQHNISLWRCVVTGSFPTSAETRCKEHMCLCVVLRWCTVGFHSQTNACMVYALYACTLQAHTPKCMCMHGTCLYIYTYIKHTHTYSMCMHWYMFVWCVHLCIVHGHVCVYMWLCCALSCWITLFFSVCVSWTSNISTCSSYRSPTT